MNVNDLLYPCLTVSLKPKAFKAWFLPIFSLGLLAACVLFFVFCIDFSEKKLFGPGELSRYFDFAPESVSNSIGVLSSIVAAVLGIVITVVSIVVQLAATRYTAAVSDIFLKDKKNRWTIGFYIVSCIVGLWVAFAVQDTWVPRTGLVLMLVLATFCFLLMPPYFNHVFKLLSPKAIVKTIENAVDQVLFKQKNIAVHKKQIAVMEQIETLCDIAINSVAQKDRIIAIETVDTLSRVTTSYIERREELSRAWFSEKEALHKNPDFSSLDPAFLERLRTKHTWFEFKVFRQYQTIYNEALGNMSIVNYEIAIQLRKNAEKAASTKNGKHILGIAIKFFNTFLRTTINNKDIRTTYTILNQYRSLAIFLLRNDHGDLTLNMANYMKYYGHVAHEKKLGFITEIVAYDIGEICEKAHQLAHPIEKPLLETFLEVDPCHVQDRIQEKALQGVRKAQIKLASYYLVHDDETKARAIWKDMHNENQTRLESIKKELLSVNIKEFWEISERSEDFDFLQDSQKTKMEEFFTWFNF